MLTLRDRPMTFLDETRDPLIMPDERLSNLGEMYLLMCQAHGNDVLMRGVCPIPFFQFVADQNSALQTATDIAARRQKQLRRKPEVAA